MSRLGKTGPSMHPLVSKLGLGTAQFGLDEWRISTSPIACAPAVLDALQADLAAVMLRYQRATSQPYIDARAPNFGVSLAAGGLYVPGSLRIIDFGATGVVTAPPPKAPRRRTRRTPTATRSPRRAGDPRPRRRRG